MLWKFILDDSDGTEVYCDYPPPHWTDNMTSARLVDAPADIAAEFTSEAKERFRQEYGANLHTVTRNPSDPPGTYKRNARIC